MNLLRPLALGAALLAFCLGATAQEVQIKKNIDARLPQLQGVQEVRKTPIPGIYEIRVQDSEIYYTDAKR